MRTKTLKYILTSFLCLLTFASFGQGDTIAKKNKYYYWLNISGQPIFSDNFDFLIGGQLGLNFSINQRHFIQFKGYECSTLNGFPFSETTPDKLVYLKNISALYGIGHIQTNTFLIITSTGLSYGNATYRGEELYINHPGNCLVCWDTPVYEYDKYSYFGLPLYASFMFTSPFVGLSFDIYANIHKHPDYGLILNFHFGKITDKKTTANTGL